MTGTVTFKDEITINEISEGVNHLRDAIKKGSEVVVDAASVKRIDIAGLQMFLAVQKECKSLNKKLTLRSSDAVKELLSLIGMKI